MKAPCKGCTGRHTACHDTCERYRAWIDEKHEIREREREDGKIAGYFRDSVDKQRKYTERMKRR